MTAVGENGGAISKRPLKGDENQWTALGSNLGTGERREERIEERELYALCIVIKTA